MTITVEKIMKEFDMTADESLNFLIKIERAKKELQGEREALKEGK